jgi:hypothetical protein
MLTEVAILFDHLGLATVKLALGALAERSQSLSANIDAQVQKAVDQENAKPQPLPESSMPVPQANGHAHETL